MAMNASVTGENQIDRDPSAEEVVKEAIGYLDLLLATKMQELLENSAKAKMSPEQTMSAALAIQDLALSMAAQVDKVMLEMAKSSEDFSPRTLSASVLRLELEEVPELRIIFNGRKKQLASKVFDAKRVADLVLINDGKLIADILKIWMVGDAKMIVLLELYLRRKLPIDRLMTVNDRALFDKVSKE